MGGTFGQFDRAQLRDSNSLEKRESSLSHYAGDPAAARPIVYESFSGKSDAPGSR